MKKEAILSLLASWIMRALALTLRFKCNDLAGYFAPGRIRPFICGVWHNRIFITPILFEHYRRGQRMAVLTSASKDGTLVTAINERFGLENVRGSSSKRGGVALRELHSKLDEGCDVVITPDGPRGPVYKVSSGIVFLASQTELPLVFIHISYSRFWQAKSWDGFRIPKPFSTVEMTLTPAPPLGKLETDEEFETARALIAKGLHTAAELEKITVS